MQTSKLCAAAGAACAALLVTTAPAAAVPPGAVTFTMTFPGTDTAGEDGYCAFPVRLEVVNNQTYTTTPGPGGTATTRFAGAAFVTAVNDLTGTSVRYNASGPGTTVTAPNGSFRTDGTGPQFSLTTVGNSFDGVSPISYTTGRVFFEVDAEGMTTGYGLQGRAVDVCEALG